MSEARIIGRQDSIQNTFELRSIYTAKKIPDLDRNLILKSLAYFDDIEPEEIVYKNNHNIDFAEVKEYLKKQAVAAV